MNRMDQYIEDLKNCGLKCTGHRTAILGILDRSDQPATAEQVYSELKVQSISINLSTVYRVLDILAVNKLINRLSISRTAGPYMNTTGGSTAII